jgi:hypothetical protein
MDANKTYYDLKGNPRTIMQMVLSDPYWAANRIQEGEKAIEELAKIKEAFYRLDADYERRREENKWK